MKSNNSIPEKLDTTSKSSNQNNEQAVNNKAAAIKLD